MRKHITLIEANNVTRINNTPMNGPVIDLGGASYQGAYRDNMNIEDAKRYLDSYSDGYLGHEVMENDAFVAVDSQGRYVFYNPISDQIEGWDWVEDINNLAQWEDGTDILNGWFYCPADEMAFTKGGMAWWDEIRSGMHTPIK